MSSNNKTIFNASDIANFVVCQKAWDLKKREQLRYPQSDHAEKSFEKKREWVETQETISQIRKYGQLVFYLLVCLSVFVFCWEEIRQRSILENNNMFSNGSTEIQNVHTIPPEILALLVILGLIIFVWDTLGRKRKNLLKESGLTTKGVTVGVKGSKEIPSKVYRSEKLHIAGKPDAIIREGKDLIPVLINPLSNKVQDRHVATLLTYLMLIEEQEGNRPPYGILVMGEQARHSRLKYSEEKENWLKSIVDNMLEINEGNKIAIPSPAYYKCKNCDVENSCSDSAFLKRKKKSRKKTKQA